MTLELVDIALEERNPHPRLKNRITGKVRAVLDDVVGGRPVQHSILVPVWIEAAEGMSEEDIDLALMVKGAEIVAKMRTRLAPPVQVAPVEPSEALDDADKEADAADAALLPYTAEEPAVYDPNEEPPALAPDLSFLRCGTATAAAPVEPVAAPEADLVAEPRESAEPEAEAEADKAAGAEMAYEAKPLSVIAEDGVAVQVEPQTEAVIEAHVEFENEAIAQVAAELAEMLKADALASLDLEDDESSGEDEPGFETRYGERAESNRV